MKTIYNKDYYIDLINSKLTQNETNIETEELIKFELSLIINDSTIKSVKNHINQIKLLIKYMNNTDFNIIYSSIHSVCNSIEKFYSIDIEGNDIETPTHFHFILFAIYDIRNSINEKQKTTIKRKLILTILKKNLIL